MVTERQTGEGRRPFMSDHFQLFAYAAVAFGALAGVGHSIAAIIRETYRGKALMINVSRTDMPDAILFAVAEHQEKQPQVERQSESLNELNTGFCPLNPKD